MTVSAPDARPLVFARVRVGTTATLACLIAASFVFRTVAAWLRATPTYFPDEYIYAELARSLAETGRPLVRGAAAGFPALLEPIVAAPAWAVDDVETAYRIVQAGHALLISLVAIPVFLLARRVGIGRGTALAVAALALATPDLVYASGVLTEALAYPLALGAVATAVVAITRPGPRTQLVFVALAALAAFARLQFAVLPACFVAAVLLVGWRERRLRAALREQLVPLAAFGVAAVVAAVAGPERVLGYYRAGLELDVDAAGAFKWAAADALVLFYTSGWVLVPGALLGLGLAVARPRSRAELAFAAVTIFLAVTLLAEAGVVSAGDTARVLERYVFYAAPLLAIAFALYAARAQPLRLVHGVLAAGLAAAAASVPLSGYAAADGKIDSPFLQAVFRLEQAVGDVATGALAVAIAATVLAAVAVAAAARPRLGAPLVLVLAGAACVTASAGAIAHDLRNSAGVRAKFVPSERSWIDRSGVGTVTLLHTEGASRAGAMEQLFWNRSLDRVAYLPETDEIDAFRASRVEIRDDGVLLVDGAPHGAPLLVDEAAETLRFRGATRVADAKGYTLWRPDDVAQLSLSMLGRSYGGLLAGTGTIRLWPDEEGGRLAGRLVFRTAALDGLGEVGVEFRRAGEAPLDVTLSAGRPTTIVLPVCSTGRWDVAFVADEFVYLDGGIASGHASEPRFEPDASVCGGLDERGANPA